MAPPGEGLDADGAARSRCPPPAGSGPRRRRCWKPCSSCSRISREDVARERIEGRNDRHRPLPACLAAYMARSASATSSSTPRTSSRPETTGAMPTLAPTRSRRPATANGVVEERDDLAGQVLGNGGRAGLVEQDGELVTADPGHGVGRPEAVGEALGHPPQELVARGVAEGVVDRLEVVEVDEGDRQAGAVAVVPAVGEAHPVRRTGRGWPGPSAGRAGCGARARAGAPAGR